MNTKEKLKIRTFPAWLENSTYLVVGYGETYHSDFVKGGYLLNHIIELMFGSDHQENCSYEDWEQYGDDLCNPDNWRTDQDAGNYHWNTDVGETDHIEVWKIVT